jgi:glutathione reductase (NADPH)
MPTYDFDLFVIGAGSGGTRASRIAAGHGAKVAVAEERYLGGTCVNVGCVPKKLFVYASHYGDDFEDAKGFGWTVGKPEFDWPTLVGNKDREIERLNGIYRRMIEGAGATIFDARATIVDAHTVSVEGTQYTAKYILVAVGGWPTMPSVPGIEHAIDSNGVFYLKEFPRRIVIVGGGYIAVEFAGVFNGLGAEVSQLYRGPMFLRGFDDDIREGLAEEMRKKSIDLRFNADVDSIERLDSGALSVTVSMNGETTQIEADCVLYATGRHPVTEGLGLEKAGVKVLDSGVIPVDKFSQTNVDSVYAIGDVTDRINLTPVAIREGHLFAETVFNNNAQSPDHECVPTAVFSHPNIGTCGLTEAQARAEFGAVDIYRSAFRPMKHTLSGRDERSIMKLIVDRATDQVVGCHILGPDAGEIMQGIGIAMKCGATKAQFDSTIGIHPTSAEEIVTMREPVPELAEAAD